MKPVANILVGLPAAGKSTLTMWLNQSGRYQILSTDDLVEEVAEAHGWTYDKAFDSHYKWAEQEYDMLLKSAIENKKEIIIDRVNVSPKKRGQLVTRLKNAGYTVIAWNVICDDDEAWQKRLLSRPGKTIPDHVIRGMKNTLKYATLGDGFDEVREHRSS